jgi:hypothetical protein
MQNYGDVVQIALAGHTHMDDFLGFELAEVLGNEIAGLIMVTRTSGKTSA